MSRWNQSRDHNGLLRWESDLGTAYNSKPPPEEDPLTAEEVRALPEGSRILVLWGGGNGPHEYLWERGRVYLSEADNFGFDLGGPTAGSWELVGNKPHTDKVWYLGEYY